MCNTAAGLRSSSSGSISLQHTWPQEFMKMGQCLLRRSAPLIPLSVISSENVTLSNALVTPDFFYGRTCKRMGNGP